MATQDQEPLGFPPGPPEPPPSLPNSFPLTDEEKVLVREGDRQRLEALQQLGMVQFQIEQMEVQRRICVQKVQNALGSLQKTIGNIIRSHGIEDDPRSGKWNINTTKMVMERIG